VITEGARLGRETMREQLRVPRDARVVLFPLQIESDTNIVRYSPHYKRMVDVVRDLQRAVAVTGAILVVKPHPEDRNRLPELRRLCDDKTTRLATDLSVRSLIDAADVIVTVNSTVGLEALIAEKPVVVLGNAIYSGKG
jgi:capsular polysaccharide export protein